MSINYKDYYYKYKALKYYLKNQRIELKGGSTFVNNPVETYIDSDSNNYVNDLANDNFDPEIYKIIDNNFNSNNSDSNDSDSNDSDSNDLIQMILILILKI